MRSLLLIATFILGLSPSVWSANGNDKFTKSDSLILEKIDSLSKVDSTLIQGDTLLSNRLKLLENPTTKCQGEVLVMEWVLVFSPLLLMLIYTVLFIRGLGQSKSDDGKGMVYKMLMGGDQSPTSPPAQIPDNAPAAPSKFIAFLSGITAAIIALVVLTFYAYMLVAECNNDLNIDELWKLVMALGIGVIPYGYYIYSKGEGS